VGGGTAGAITLGLLTSCSPTQTLAWSGTAWACATPSTGGITGTGTAGYYANWLTSTTLGNANINDEGSFGDTTRFLNTYNQFNHNVFTPNGDVTGGEFSPGEGGGFGAGGRFISFYPVGSALGGGAYNEILYDLNAQQSGNGGNLQLGMNTANIGESLEVGAELKLSKTTSTVSDDTADLLITTWNAGTPNLVATFGHDSSLSVVGAGSFGGNVDMGSAGVYGWSSTAPANGTIDTGIARNAAGVLEIDNGTAGTLRDLTARNGTWTGLQSYGAHEESTGTALGSLTSCGTGSPAAATGSTDTSGKITEGTTATGCTAAFGATYTNSPFCICTANAGGAAVACDASGSTATSLVIVNASATGDVITYHCFGRSGGT
jgi:hypothetical protein